MTADTIRIGSRGSRLALVQAEWVRDRVASRHPHLAVEIEIINTKGDKILDAPLAKIGDKGLFTKELENALLDGRIDVAVHSAKDMPTAVPEGLEIIAFTEREDVRDVFVPNPSLLEPRSGSRADDARRRAAGRARGQLEPPAPLAAAGAAARPRRGGHPRQRRDAAAQAGGRGDGRHDPRGRRARRLGRSEVAGFAFDFDQMLPAVGQGALAIEARGDHPRLAELKAALDHQTTALAVTAERALLGMLEGGCQVPIAAHALWEAGGEGGAGTLALARLRRLAGRRPRGARRPRSPADDPRGLGIFLAAELLERGAGEILDEIRTP